jgi:hypothetical protein
LWFENGSRLRKTYSKTIHVLNWFAEFRDREQD